MRKAAVSVAIAMTGSALGVVILIPVIEHLIGSIGWSYAYLVLGVIVATGATIGGALLKKDPESHGTYPDGVEPTDEEMGSRADFAARLHVWTAREAFKTYSWWLLLFSQFFQIAVIGLIGHIVFWGQDLDIPKSEAVNILVLLVLAAVVGRLFGGFFSDWYMARFKISRKPILYLGTVLVAVGCLLAMWVDDSTGMLLVSILVGFGYGIGLAVFPAYIGDLYGVVSVPALFGIMFFCTAGIFGAAGPILYGGIHDSYGSYELAFMITAILCFISAATLVPIKPPSKGRSPT
jgi:cyanate permease